ncbi:hypothetical protein MRX96_027111 [Rhipicephalus microplus]
MPRTGTSDEDGVEVPRSLHDAVAEWRAQKGARYWGFNQRPMINRPTCERALRAMPAGAAALLVKRRSITAHAPPPPLPSRKQLLETALLGSISHVFPSLPNFPFRDAAQHMDASSSQVFFWGFSSKKPRHAIRDGPHRKRA